MSRRFPNPNLVKINRSYEVYELARLFKSHRNTIRGWMKKGLKPVDESRPYLLHGTDVRDFLKIQRMSPYSKCQPHELFCLKCKAPKVPRDKVVDYIPYTHSSGNLCGYCPDCGRRIFKRVNAGLLGAISAELVVRHTLAALDIGDTSSPCNSSLQSPR